MADFEGTPASPDAGVEVEVVTAPTGSKPPSRPALNVSDISDVSLLRKRVGRAAGSMKVLGVLSAVYVWVYFPSLGSWTFWVGLPLGLLVYWCARRLSSRLRAGDVAAAFLTAIWWLLWIAVVLVDAAPKAFSNPYSDFDFYVALGMLTFALPIYLIARGLVAYWRYAKRSPHRMSGHVMLPSSPWESDRRRVAKHPAFVNKRSLSLYPLLFLVPVPYFVLQLSARLRDSPIATEDTSQASLLGEQVGAAIAVLLIWLPLTVYLYRRARRRALLPAAELGTRNPRPPVLYLRSFRDDEIRMRARAANGRSNLERVLKIRFEEVVTDHLWRYGPVVAIGKPGERLPPLGAARDYVSDDQWQQKVEELMRSAALIVLVVGRTEGVAWELGKILELGLVHKLVLLFPPVSMGGDLRARWDGLRVQADRTGLAVPNIIELQGNRAMVFPTPHRTHVIVSRMSDDWAYEAVLDAAVELVGSLAHTSEPTCATDRGSGQP